MTGLEQTGLAWDGPALREALTGSAAWVEAHAEALNALNVFPVPDGDTGYNMSRALRAAADETTRASSDALGDVAWAMARGALMCPSAGNSGNVLAGILRGMARQLEGSTTAGPWEMARALREGANAAYEALERPVEGTILTVARCAADGAEQAATGKGSLRDVLESAERSARLAVAHTPELLPILKEAKVVDAGGEGYRVFLEGLGFYVRGEPVPAEEVVVSAWADLSHAGHDHDMYGYCTEVLFQGSQLNPGTVRRRLSELGTSVLVVGDARLLKVHLHTLRPGTVLDLALELGEIVKVKVDNMQLQHNQFVRQLAEERVGRADSQERERESSSPERVQAQPGGRADSPEGRRELSFPARLQAQPESPAGRAARRPTARTAIVTDSTADFAEFDPAEHGVTTLPLTIAWGADVVRDKVDLSTADFYRRLRTDPRLPKTSAPPIGLFEQAYRELLETHEHVISLHIASSLSGTYNAAAAAARSVAPDRIWTIDSRSLSVCLGWLVERAAELVEADEEPKVIVEQLDDLITRLRLMGALETLEFVQKGGRIGKARALLGGLLSVKPILQVVNGEVQPVENVRTRAASLDRLVELAVALGPKQRVAVVYGGCEDEAEALRDQLAQREEQSLPMAEIGSVFGVHAGPGVLGVGCLLAK